MQNSVKPSKGSRSSRIRRGRGIGSKGTYSGRGMKGQSARSGGRRRPGFEGGQTPLFRRMPKLKGFKNINRVEFQVVNIASLNRFDDKATVGIDELYNARLISSRKKPVKLLGNGKIEKKVTITVDKASKKAIEAVEEAGGKVEVIMKATNNEQPTTNKKEA